MSEETRNSSAQTPDERRFVAGIRQQMFAPRTAPDTEALAAPLEDIDILTTPDSLDLYEDYEFYQWLAENDAQV